MSRNTCLVLLFLVCTSALADSPPQVASLGDLKLSSGEVLLDSKIAYRIAGTLNADRSNVIVFLTWFTGTSEDLVRYELVGPGKLADTDRYHVISIDAFGNGVSTSPSNSAQQPGAQFPVISIEDMVNAQHLLLTKHLGIQRARAVIGLSMGGMQTFQWMGQYPGFMDKAIPIEGSPKMTSYDLLQWQTHEMAIEMMHEAGVTNSDIMRYLAALNLLTLWTPDFFVSTVPPEGLAEFLAESASGSAGGNAYDYLSQLRAMMAHDVFAHAGETEQDYVNALKADVLVINFTSDQMVNPAPGKALAESIEEDYAGIDTVCGHMGTTCEAARIVGLTHQFLERAD